MKSTILVTGYKNFELGIFQDKDPRITIRLPAKLKS